MLGKLFGKGEDPPRVDADDHGVRRQLADGSVESVTWDALQEVRVMTTSDGPLAEDVFYVLDGGTQGCVVPQGLAPADFLDRLQALEGFDDEKLIEAMGSTTAAEFILWRR